MRIQSLDLARGFTVLFIPAIHSVMLYSKPEVYTTWLGYPLQFIAEGPGGQLFMVIMGIVCTFKSTYRWKGVVKKSLLLLAAGYGLNVLKFVVPYSLDLLPPGAQHDLKLSQQALAYWQLFSLGDILHFAAIAGVVIHLVYQSKYYPYIAAVMAAAIIVVSPFLWDMHHSQPSINYTLQLLTGQPPRVFFPVFPWLSYPLIGLAIGYSVQKQRDRTFIWCGLAGLGCLTGGLLLAFVTHEHAEAGFYRTGPFETIAHIGIIGITLFAWHIAAHRIRKNQFFQLLEYSSEHITQIYCIQWILICWLLPFIGYQQLGVWASCVMAIATTGMTYMIATMINLLHEYGKAN